MAKNCHVLLNDVTQIVNDVTLIRNDVTPNVTSLLSPPFVTSLVTYQTLVPLSHFEVMPIFIQRIVLSQKQDLFQMRFEPKLFIESYLYFTSVVLCLRAMLLLLLFPDKSSHSCFILK